MSSGPLSHDMSTPDELSTPTSNRSRDSSEEKESILMADMLFKDDMEPETRRPEIRSLGNLSIVSRKKLDTYSVKRNIPYVVEYKDGERFVMDPVNVGFLSIHVS